MTYAQLIELLKERGLHSSIARIQNEKAEAQDKVSAPTAKKSASLAAETYFAHTVSSLLEGKPIRVAQSGARWDIVCEIMRGLGASVASADTELDAAVKQGQKLKVDFDDGAFTARLGEVVVDGESVEAVLEALKNELKKSLGIMSAGIEAERSAAF